MEANISKKSDNEEPSSVSRFIIRIRLHGSSRSDLYDPLKLQLRVGDWVIVETKEGPSLGRVASNKSINFRKDCSSAHPNVLRLANEKDFELTEKKEAFENKSKQICLDQIKRLKLPMNLSRVKYQKDIHKITFFFTAEGRIDFRELVRVLAHNLRSRIEMRQVGLRDEAKAIDGYGICGQSLCCSKFLNEFTPVTIRMAKDQGLSLNRSKISGACGRLMCCLQYEHDLYKDLVKLLPKVGSRVEAPEGWGKVVKNNILEKIVTVLLDDESYMTYHLDELKNFETLDLPKDEGILEHSEKNSKED